MDAGGEERGGGDGEGNGGAVLGREWECGNGVVYKSMGMGVSKGEG